MNIQLNQAEIVSAIRQYVEQQGISMRNKTLEVDFTSGRKENGLTASLTITEAVGTLPPAGPVPRATPFAEATATDAPVETPADVVVEETAEEAKPVTASLFG